MPCDDHLVEGGPGRTVGPWQVMDVAHSATVRRVTELLISLGRDREAAELADALVVDGETGADPGDGTDQPPHRRPD